ncbi:hypothetical protein OWR29_39360 [Actinoplanes sp. Pm04-4]|uniref:Uncharacterized protein n=1 Tax=Paractinoplanes pyxinae TaxID=2997416 RepID=A0ABT4BC87_9ACTN|nr:hypothetical protein [Actinoplanes pyxinae]MCY1144091.1 hypothetical protein [Actinoplanes pyxinae]
MHAVKPISDGTLRHYADGVVWTCEHRSTDEIEVAAEALTSAGDSAQGQLSLLRRIIDAKPLSGESWHRRLGEHLRGSAYRDLVREHHVRRARTAIENTNILLTRGDPLGAAMSSRAALNATVDALLTGAGYGVPADPRRRDTVALLAESGHPLGRLLSPQRYQDVQTMRGLYVDDAETWVGFVLTICLTILLALEAQDALPDLVEHLESIS